MLLLLLQGPITTTQAILSLTLCSDAEALAAVFKAVTTLSTLVKTVQAQRDTVDQEFQK